MGALKGNNTMLDNYGMAVNDALVKTRAFEMGLSDGTGELSLQANRPQRWHSFMSRRQQRKVRRHVRQMVRWCDEST